MAFLSQLYDVFTYGEAARLGTFVRHLWLSMDHNKQISINGFNAQPRIAACFFFV